MAPSPTKRTTRSAKTKQSGKVAAKRKGESVDSGYGGSDILLWSPSLLEDVEAQGHNEKPVSPAKRQRTATVNAQGISPGERKHHADLPGLNTDLHVTRRSPRKAARRSKRRVRIVSPVEEDDGGLWSPVDHQLQAEMLATMPKTYSQNHSHRSGIDPGILGDEMAHALDYFSHPGNRNHQQAIQAFFQAYPKQPQTDKTYKHRYQALRNAAWNWARTFFPGADAPFSGPLDLMGLATQHPQLMEYINCTTANPNVGSWEELLDTRRAEIVFSILSKVLEVHIFGEELFGATPVQKKALQTVDFELFDADGFTRQRNRANLISSFLRPSSIFPDEFLPSLRKLHLRLINLLGPLSPVYQVRRAATAPRSDFSTPQFAILLLAAKLHVDIRQETDVIYYFVPAPAAGSAYDREAMNIVGSWDMEPQAPNPSTRSAFRKGGRKRVAAITGWPACVAYRAVVPLPSSHPTEEEKRRGVSTHVLARADVFIGFAAVDRSRAVGKATRATLRQEMYRRANEMKQQAAAAEEKGKKKNTEKRLGVAAAAVGVAGMATWIISGGGR